MKTPPCKYYIGHAFEDRKTFDYLDANAKGIWVEWVGLEQAPSLVPDEQATGWKVTDGFNINSRPRLTLAQAMGQAHEELFELKAEWDRRAPEAE